MNDNCLDCGRPRARTWQEVVDGGCPKFYAIMDSDAEQDCQRTVNERAVYNKITDLEWRIQQLEERMRLQ